MKLQQENNNNNNNKEEAIKRMCANRMGASYVRDLSVSSLITTTTGTARLTWGGGAELSEGDDLMVCMCVCVWKKQKQSQVS